MFLTFVPVSSARAGPVRPLIAGERVSLVPDHVSPASGVRRGGVCVAGRRAARLRRQEVPGAQQEGTTLSDYLEKFYEIYYHK